MATVSLILTLLVSSALAQSTRCRVSDYIISRDQQLTPPSDVVASGSRSTFSYPPRNVLHFGYSTDDDLNTWCADTFSDISHYIIIHFNQLVLIQSFLASGTTNYITSSILDIYHLTNFTLEYTNNSTGGQFVYYTEEDGEVKYFNQAQLVELFQLERPIITTAIRFRPIQWHDSSGRQTFQYVCLGVALFGCTANETLEETTAVPTSTTDSTSAATTKTESMPTVESVVEPVIIRDYQVLEIALPIALITILVVIATTVVGILLCLKKGKQSSHYDIPLESSMAPLSPTSMVLDNSTLYNKSSEMGERIERVVNNKLYGQNSLSRTNIPTDTYPHQGDNLEIIYSDGQYEYVSGDPQLSGNSSDQESMEDNSAYVFSESGQEVETTSTKKENFGVNCSEPINEKLHAMNLYEETVH